MAAAPAETPRPRPEPFIPSRIEGPPPSEPSGPSEAAGDQPTNGTPPATNGAAPDGALTPGLPMTHPAAPTAYPTRPLGARPASPDGGTMTASAGCTAPQLRRFIKSRPYVPMHELRRRFGINGQEDDVTPVDLAVGRIFVGLPTREGGLLGELLRGGEVGYELSLDPRSPIVVGLYPMRPVPRS
jgi:hypothetical protein